MSLTHKRHYIALITSSLYCELLAVDEIRVNKIALHLDYAGVVKYWKSQKNSFFKDLFIVGFQPLGIKKINNKGFLKVENILVSVYDIILVVSLYFYAFSNILEYIRI